MQDASTVHRRLKVALLGCLALALTAGCGGSSEPDSSDQASSRQPIKVGQFNQEGGASGVNYVDATKAAQAAVQYVNNDLGGVNGRPLVLVPCATKGTPEGTTSCANDLVDKGVDVVLKANDANAAIAVPIVTGAGITYASTALTSEAELKTAGVYGFGAGTLSFPISWAGMSKDKGYGKVGYIYNNVASQTSLLNNVTIPAFKAAGVELVPLSTTLQTPDLLPVVSQAIAQDVDAIACFGIVAQCVSVEKALALRKSELPVMTLDATDEASFYSSSPDGAEGVFIAYRNSYRLAEDPDTVAYVDAMKKYAPSVDPGGVQSLAFQNIVNLQRVLAAAPDAGKLDKTSVKAAFAAAKDVPMFLAKDVKMTCDGSLISASLCSDTSTVFQVTGAGKTFTFVGSYKISDFIK